MISTFSGLEMGKRSLFAHQKALQTVGHNVSNASVKGYSRQRVKMAATESLYMPQLNRPDRPGRLGQGVDVVEIERIRDNLLQGQIVGEGHNVGYWKSRDYYIKMVEQVYNEPKETSVRQMMDQFWQGWQELSLDPDQLGVRDVLQQRGAALIDSIHTRYRRLKETAMMVNDDLKNSVKEINGLLNNISEVNDEIVRSESVGDNPNDLYDERDRMVEQLSGYMNITVKNADPDEFSVYTGGRHLIQGKHVFALDTKTDPANEGYLRFVWKENDEDVNPRGGKTASLLELRDKDIKGEIQNLDLLTANFTDMVNRLHRRGEGLNGKKGLDFFTEYPFVENRSGNYDLNEDGVLDHSLIFRISGGNALKASRQIGLEGVLTLSGREGNVEVPYKATDTVKDLIRRINTSGAEVTASLDRGGFLVLKGTPAGDTRNVDFAIRYVGDSGLFLSGYAGILANNGPNGAFRWDIPDAVNRLNQNSTEWAVAPRSHPAGWMQINPAISGDAASIAAGFAREDGQPVFSGDGSLARSVADLREAPVMIGRSRRFSDYFADTVANIGEKGKIAQESLGAQELILKNLKDTQDNIAGVNMDEEMTEMIKFQRGYAAAARFITTMDKLLGTIIDTMGVT